MAGYNGRMAGILMHITSLPGPYGIGDIGPSARELVRLAASMGLGVWQTLPLTVTSPVYGRSPYSSPSAFAGSPLLISPDDLLRDGIISEEAAQRSEVMSPSRVDYDAASTAKRRLLVEAHENFRRDEAYKTKFRELSDDFWRFCSDNAWWLEDYALFTVLKGLSGGAAWTEWREAFRDRDWSTLDPLKGTKFVSHELDRIRFEQFLFFRQLDELREVCAAEGVLMIGDLPIYVCDDSADVWGHRELFELDEEGRPASVAGVPPDYFSETGQRWGSPLYRWDRMRDDGWSWWMGRLGHALRMADIVRIDHFRGLLGYWAIPAEEETAVGGAWREGPGTDLIAEIVRRFASPERMPFIAEDLGVITDDVREAMARFGLPGMKVLEFAFGGEVGSNAYAPHHHVKNCVIYTGTHDNNTALGWWRDDATDEERAAMRAYTGKRLASDSDAAAELVRLALSSTADIAVIPAQDLIGKGSEARMNTPSTTKGNWEWRLGSLDALRSASERVREAAILYGRCAPSSDDEDLPSAIVQNDQSM